MLNKPGASAIITTAKPRGPPKPSGMTVKNKAVIKIRGHSELAARRAREFVVRRCRHPGKS